MFKRIHKIFENYLSQGWWRKEKGKEREGEGEGDRGGEKNYYWKDPFTAHEKTKDPTFV